MQIIVVHLFIISSLETFFSWYLFSSRSGSDGSEKRSDNNLLEASAQKIHDWSAKLGKITQFRRRLRSKGDLSKDLPPPSIVIVIIITINFHLSYLRSASTPQDGFQSPPRVSTPEVSKLTCWHPGWGR